MPRPPFTALLAALLAVPTGGLASSAAKPAPVAPAVPEPATAPPPIVRVHPDGRVEFAGEKPGLGAALLAFERAVAPYRSDRAGLATAPPPGELRAWATLLAALDQALATTPQRLELLRAAAALEAHLAAAQERYPELPIELEDAIVDRGVRLEDSLQRPLETIKVSGLADLDFPVEPAVVTSFFGLRRDPFDGRERYHFGLDLQGRKGDEVRAAAAGKVVSAGWAGGHGMRVEIDHGDGMVTGYSHLSAVLVSAGSWIPAGQLVGRVGSTGRSTGPHLHFELWRDGEPEDPLQHLGAETTIEVRAALQ